jgi:pyruvate dehydrogenase E2 component (dihydrolipoamide acetyltransferase)
LIEISLPKIIFSMATVVIMPKQGQSVESCIITEWNKKKGDPVAKGEILFAYETDKASFEEEAAVDGILLEIFYETGGEVPVLTNVCVIGAAGESADAYRPGGVAPIKEESASPVVAVEKTTSITKESVSKVVIPPTGSGAISPRARILADKEGILTDGLTGTGPQGRIIEQDVLAVIASKS